ncbi:MAG: hypothetical protein MSL49_09070 [Lactobacillus johnsonii]|nr:hypothetical protein [Lactobacillus johnsonii]
MHNRKKLNIGISSLILGALFLEFNVSQVKADNVKTSLNQNEQTNAKVINQNEASRNNAIAQNSVTNSKFNASLVSSSNNQNDLDKKLVGAQETKNNIENEKQTSTNAVQLNAKVTSQWVPASPSLYSVKNDNTNKWRYNSNIKTWSYVKSDGTDANQEWLKDKDNQWYYFDKNGNMASNGWFATTSTQEDNGKKYYFNKDGHYLTDYWAYDPYGKTWSYARNDGVQANDQWVKAKDNQWYYFDFNGDMVTNSWFDTNGKIYYFDKNGHYLTNHWVYSSDENIWRYAKKDGTQATEEWLKMPDGHWYYFDVSGIMAADGWKLTTWGVDNAEEYYFDKNGHYLTNHWTYDKYDKTWSYAKKDGTQAAADWLKSSDGYWYYFDDYGVMVTNGWYDTLSEGSWKKYYFDKNGHPLTLHLTTEFDKTGSPITNQWVYDSKNKLWGYTKHDGTPALEEWVKTPNGQWYYFNNAGVMAKDGWYNTQLKDGNWRKYYFDKDGHYLTDHWVYDSYGKTWSYAKYDGTQAIGEWVKTPNGRWYYFDNIGMMPTNVLLYTHTKNDVWKPYYFAKDGNYMTNAWAYDSADKMWIYTKNDGIPAVQEWLKNNDGQWYYFTASEAMAANGWFRTRCANDYWKIYYFDKNGHYLTNHWAYDADNKTWSYAKNDGTRATEEWIKTSSGQWYYFDKNGNMAKDGYYDTYVGNGKWKKYYFDRDGHYYQI